jgi:hypothetical protein
VLKLTLLEFGSSCVKRAKFQKIAAATCSGLAASLRPDLPWLPSGGSAFVMEAFARHGATPQVGPFRGGRYMVDLWEQWTETSSTRDSSRRNSVVGDFGLSIVVRQKIGWRPVRVAFPNV